MNLGKGKNRDDGGESWQESEDEGSELWSQEERAAGGWEIRIKEP